MRIKSKEREEKILKSPNFKKGAFQNLSITPMIAADTNYITVILDLLHKPAERNVNITTPMIGQPVVISESYPNEAWWNF